MNHIENEVTLYYIQAGGPGGQNINKVATSVQLRFDIAHSPTLGEDVKKRLQKLAGKRVTGDGILIIEARRFRSQERNRSDVLERFRKLVKQANTKSPTRKRTVPTRSSIEKRIRTKKKRGELKKSRKEQMGVGE